MSTPKDYEADREDLEAWLAFEPDEMPDDLTDEEINAMEQQAQDEEFFRNHPSLSVAERNPNLT